MSFYRQGASAPITSNPLALAFSQINQGNLHFYKKGSVNVGGKVTNWVAETILDVVHILLLIAGMFAVGRIVL